MSRGTSRFMMSSWAEVILGSEKIEEEEMVAQTWD